MRQQSIHLYNVSATPAAPQVQVHRRVEWGRKAILCGCLMALVGMVAYCYSTLGGGPDAGIAGSLFENGIVGWAAFVLLVTGVGIWMAGNVALMVEADRAETDH